MQELDSILLEACSKAEQSVYIRVNNKGCLYLEVDRGSVLRKEVYLDSFFGSFYFRVRIQELSAFFPGLEIVVQYKGWPPVVYKSRGMVSLLDFIEPNSKAVTWQAEGLDLAFCLSDSPMERAKVFTGFSEELSGSGQFREAFQWAHTLLYGKPAATRTQRLESILSAKATYFGTFGYVLSNESCPGQLAEQTIPGLVLCMRIDEGVDIEPVLRSHMFRWLLSLDLKKES